MPYPFNSILSLCISNFGRFSSAIHGFLTCGHPILVAFGNVLTTVLMNVCFADHQNFSLINASAMSDGGKATKKGEHAQIQRITPLLKLSLSLFRLFLEVP